jgi:predicted aconitase with swiveling domain
MKFHGRQIVAGYTSGAALVSKKAISFYGGVDPTSGIITEKDHDLEGQSITGKILIFSTGKGSTVGSYTLYRLKANKKAPLAIINAESEPITAVGCILAEIPCVDHIPIHQLNTGMRLIVDAEKGFVEVIE